MIRRTVLHGRTRPAARRYEYLLLATTRTSTLDEELNDAGQRGYALVGVSVGETAFGGEEVVVITRRVSAP